ncbi:MAG: PIN domain-containing protein [Isosphaeraceae bacterium]
MLTDTGPLIALINRNDPNHRRCLTASQRLPAARLITTWPCFTEAMYLLHRAAGHAGQAALWRLLSGDRLELIDLSSIETDRMADLMHKYQDQPMDLADASLVVAAERLGASSIFTPDRHFLVYRLVDGSALSAIP